MTCPDERDRSVATVTALPTWPRRVSIAVAVYETGAEMGRHDVMRDALSTLAEIRAELKNGGRG